MQALRNILKNQSGATAIEYGLIAGLVSVVIIAIMTTLGGGLEAAFATIATALGYTPE